MNRQDRIVRRNKSVPDRSLSPTLLLALIILLVTGFGFYRFACYLVNDSKMFSLQKIEVEGNGYISSAEILQKARLTLGEQLYQIEPEAVIRRILTIPYLRGVSVSRSLPSTLIISVQERQPVAYLVDRNIYMVDRNGKILLKKPGMSLQNLPLITGLTVAKLLENRQPLLQALNLIRKVDSVDPDLFQLISEVHIQYQTPPRFYLIRGGAVVELGRTRQPAKIYLLSELIKKTAVLNELNRIKRIDLRFNDRIVITRKS